MSKKVLCRSCSGQCCRYFALPIDTPETKADYDDIRWFLCHRGISVFVEDGDWYINIKNKCRYLTEDGRCDIYSQRPKICKKYKIADCDFTEGGYDYELHFTSDKEMEEYIKIKFHNNVKEKRKTRTRKKPARKK